MAMDANGFLARLAEGERSFPGVEIAWADPTRVDLRLTDLTRSRWVGVDLRGADLGRTPPPSGCLV